jgi:Pyruvate/2-oxoacid:ferredoxin oxidoreductase delta subunit
MPADTTEVDEALVEGVRMKWLSTIAAADGKTITVEKMRLDSDGRPQPTGEFAELRADAVVLALGQDVDRSLLDTLPGLNVADGVVEVGPDMMTGVAGFFAAGDAAPAQRSVTVAIGHGNAAARSIDEWLRRRPRRRRYGSRADPAAVDPVPFERLNTWYYSDAPHAVRPRLDAMRRISDFSEVVGGLDEQTALYEARRCLSCGNCFCCDNCYGVCPDNAIHKVADPSVPHGYVIDYDYCKGCGLCAAECPCGAIIMEPEPD